MSSVFLLVPILLAIAGGALVLWLPVSGERMRNIYLEAVTILTSVVVWILMAAIGIGSEPAILYSFTRGFSISFGLDGLSVLFATMVSVMWPLVLLYAFDYMHGDAKGRSFFAFYVMTYGAALGVAFSSNITTMYVFYEMLSLVTIPLVVHYGDHESMYAGRVYAAYTIGGAALTFFAVVLTTLNGAAGSFIYGGSIASGVDAPIMRIAFLLGFFGFATKAAIFPLHKWLPTASVAPTPVTALLHAVAVVNSGIFAVARMTYYVFGTEILAGSVEQTICLVATEFTILYAAAHALRERHFKRRLAYSTVSNLSYMLFGLMLMTPEGLTGGLLHMVFHGVMKIVMFMCAGAFMERTGNAYIYEINGVGRKMPVTFLCYTIGALSLTGIPLFCGFISKWKLFMAGAAAGTAWSYLGVFALVTAAFLCAMYTMTICVRAFFTSEDQDRYASRSDVKEAHVLMLIPIVFFAILTVVFGIWSAPIQNFVTAIAQGLI